MHNVGFALDSGFRVLVTCLVLGAGLPALFAIGLRAQAWTGPRSRPVGMTIGYACFGVVLLGVVLGLAFIVLSGFGMALSFEHVFPMIVDKH